MVYDPEAVTAADVAIAVSGAQLVPGVYHGTVTTTWANGGLAVPVIFTVTASLGSPPTAVAIVNAASQVPAAVAPGEIITIFGTGMGNSMNRLTLTNGKVATTLGATQVMINGINAPLVYASPSQLSVVVPFEVDSSAIANIQVESLGARSAIEQEIVEIFEWAKQLGFEIESMDRGVLCYLSPPFEQNALRAGGISEVSRTWRHSDLARFTCCNVSRAERPAPKRRSEWWEETLQTFASASTHRSNSTVMYI